MRFWYTVAICLFATAVFADYPPLISGRITVFGSKIEVSPSLMETPAGVPVFINTTGKGLAGKIIGELRGPSLTSAITIETTPGSPFQLPALTVKGAHYLEDIRLVDSSNHILATATPNRVEIDVIEILITQVTSRPLSLEEIRSLGIVINKNNYSATSFEVGLQFNSRQIVVSFPVLLPKVPDLSPLIPPVLGSVGFAGISPPAESLGLDMPLPYIVPVDFKPDASFEFDGALPDIPGILVFPNEIAFLNQFFAVALLVTNGATQGSSLSVEGLTAQAVLDPDDLRLAKTNPAVPLGSPVPVRMPGADGVLGTVDDVNLIIAQQTAKADFFIEGLTEGTHIVKLNLQGTLHGLVQGDVPISGTATGAVIVRNPNFSITFSHPSVVRAQEPYDLFITVTNTSTIDANLVRLTIPSNALVNCTIQGDSYQDFEIIHSGESATASFRVIPQVTGQVSASVITSSGNLQGQFQFRVGVGERGIPLSPDTLVLPQFAGSLGPDLQQKALSVLGLAYSAATAPPGGLPPGIPYVSRQIVFQRATELAQAGQRYELGEPRAAALSHLLLDWLGNWDPDEPFDVLLHSTQKGREFLDEIFRQMNVGGSNAQSFHQTFASTTAFRGRYLSLMMQSSGTAPAISFSDAGGASLPDVPNADLLKSDDGQAQWILVGNYPDHPSYTLRLSGAGAASTASLSLVVPIGTDFYRAEWNSLAIDPGKTYELVIDDTHPSLPELNLSLRDESGAFYSSALQVVPVPPLQVLAVVQDAKADKTGHTIAVLMSRPVTKTSAETVANYSVSGNRTAAAQLQRDGRVIYLSFYNPISPLLDNDLIVSGMDPPLAGNNSVTVPIRTTVSTDAGRVTGRVLGSDGLPIPLAPVTMTETDTDEIQGETVSHVTATTVTDASGQFAFDYVRKLSYPFTVTAQDPLSGDVSTAGSAITQPNQLIRLDVVMFGRGAVKGRVFKRVDGTIMPLANMVVQASSLTDHDSASALTDSNGNFTIERLVVGSINLSAQNQNLTDPVKYFGATSTSIPAPGSVVTADIEATSYQPGKVSGRVLQFNGIDAIANAFVLLSVNIGPSLTLQLSAITDSQGWFRFEQVPAGTVGLEATDRSTGQKIGAISISLQAGGSVTANIVAKGTGSIETYVVLASGMNVSDVAVVIQNTSFYVDPLVTSPVRFDGVPVGNWTVTAINKRTGDRVSGAASILYASSVSVMTLRFPEKGTISGNVKTVDGLAAARATVLLFNGSGSLLQVTQTDTSGHYLLQDLPFNGSDPRDSYQIHALSENQNDGGSADPVRLTSAVRNVISNVTFLGKGSITVHVETSAGSVMTPVYLQTVTFEVDGRIGRSITYQKTTNATTGDAIFDDIFRTGFSVHASTALTLPGYFSGTLDGPSTTVNLLLDPNPNITGVVHDADGNPVPATVTYAGDSGSQTVQADAAGQFAFSRLAIGRAVFTADYNASKGQLITSIGEENPPIDIHLLGFGDIHGMVKDANGNPLAGASLKLSISGIIPVSLQSVSASDGTFHFTNLPEGTVNLEASNGVVGGRASGQIIKHQDVSMDVVLDASGTVQGTLFGPDGTTRKPSVEVTLTRNLSGAPPAVTTTDGNGNFIFRYVALSRGDQEFYVLGALDKTSGRRAQSASFLVTTNGEVVTRNLVLQSRGNVSGFVFDSGGQDAIDGAQLTLQSSGLVQESLSSSSGVAGDYSFQGVPSGSFTVTARKDLLAGQAQGQIQTEGQTVQTNIYLQPSVTLTGSVVFPDGSALPAGINPVITVIGPSVNLFADAPDGQFRIEALPQGSYILTTSITYNAKPFRGIARVTAIDPGETAVSLRLKGLNTLNVLVNGFTDTSTVVSLTYKNDMENRTESMAALTGNASFIYVPESTFTVTAVTGNLLKGSASGEFTGDGETQNITITLTTSGSVTGTVLNASQQPAANTSVTLTGGGFTLFAYTDSAGMFRIDGVPLGNYQILFEDVINGGKARATGSIDAQSETDDYQITLDAVPPTVVSSVPSAGAVNISNDSTIQIVFSEPMDSASVQSAFALTSAAGKIAGTLTLNGAALTFVPAQVLAPQQTFSIVIAASAEDLAGNRLGSDFTASFTTVDTVAPGINQTLPVNLAYNVPVNTNIQVYFNEPIANLGTYTVTRSSGLAANVGKENWNASHTTLTLIFSTAFQENEHITFTISGYGDIAGNVQSAATQIAFDTIDTTPPAAPVLASTASNNQMREGTPVSISTAVSEPLVNVDFYLNGTFKVHDTIVPFDYAIPASLTTIAANGSDQLVVEATATDRSGNVSAKSRLVIQLLPDTAPQINISSTPPPGVVFIGSDIHLDYMASDDGTVTKVLILITGGINQTIDVGATTSGSRDIPVTNVPDGASLFIKARATDDSGKTTTSSELSFTTEKDTIPPVVNLTSPPGGLMDANTGNPFTVSADVTDNVKVTKVEFTFNGNTVLDTASPYRTEFTAPAVDIDTSYAGSVKAYDLEGNTTIVDFTIVVKPLLPLPGHYVKRYGDNTFQITPLSSTPARWLTWGPVDLKYYPNILFTLQTSTCCGENVPAGSNVYLAYSKDTVSWTPFFSWDLPSHSNGYFDNYITASAAAQNAGPVFIAFFSNGGDNQPHYLFTGHVAIQLEGFSNLDPIFRYETGSLANSVFPVLETEWPTSNYRIRWDLTNFSRLRFTVSGPNTGTTFAQLTIQYFDTSSASWKYAGGGSGTWVSLNDSPAVSPWIDLETANKTDALLRYVVRDGDGIVKATYAKNILIELQSSTDFSRLLISKHPYVYFGNDDNTKTWTDMPSTETDLTDYSGSALNVEYRILATNATEVRIRTQVVTPGASTARLRLKFWNGSSWQSFSASNPEVSLGTVGEKVSAWIPLPAAAKQNALRIRFFGIGGNFSADPQFEIPQFEFRGPIEQRTP